MFEFQLFDAAKLDDATVQTLHDRADNLAELQRGFSDACVRLVPPATSFSEWVRRHIEKRAVDMQSFFDAHFYPSRPKVCEHAHRLSFGTNRGRF